MINYVRNCRKSPLQSLKSVQCFTNHHNQLEPHHLQRFQPPPEHRAEPAGKNILLFSYAYFLLKSCYYVFDLRISTVGLLYVTQGYLLEGSGSGGSVTLNFSAHFSKKGLSFVVGLEAFFGNKVLPPYVLKRKRYYQKTRDLDRHLALSRVIDLN